MNAFNFIDGADGLAALLSGMASIAFVAISSPWQVINYSR